MLPLSSSIPNVCIRGPSPSFQFSMAFLISVPISIAVPGGNDVLGSSIDQLCLTSSSTTPAIPGSLEAIFFMISGAMLVFSELMAIASGDYPPVGVQFDVLKRD